MNAQIAHRGPDGEGIKDLGPLILGHRRLAIIDLSPSASQPMQDSRGQCWIVFNGEIYNFLELREELHRTGAEFRTRSDTEVILEAYKHWGIECVKRFNGMFAFALWDARSRQLVLARDRLGKKPLYYYLFPGGGVSFASETKALCADPDIPRRLNPAALNQYLSLNYTLTQEAMLRGVQKLPAAHWLVLEEMKPPRQACYWDLAAAFQNKRRFHSEAEAEEELCALIDDSVRLRLISDVPLGAFLSGGIDSSAIVAAMCKWHEPQEVFSFSAGFKEKSYSELSEARRVAAALGVTHRESYVLPDAAVLLPHIAHFADEPFSDSSMIPMYLLAEFCRRYVTVCLSGDGGDEIFAGYETYKADKVHHWIQKLPGWFMHSLGHAFERFWPVSYDKVSFDYKVRQFLGGSTLPPDRAHYHWRTIFSNQEKTELLQTGAREILEADPFMSFQAFDRELKDSHYLDRAMYVDIKTWLVDDILVKVDRSTMAHGLEARAPLLDYRIVEFAASLPVNLKMKAFTTKYLFRKSQKDRLPGFVLKRAKQGFNAPVSHWMIKDLRDRFSDLTLNAKEDGLAFNPAFVNRLWDEHGKKVQDHSLKLLSLINLQLWCREYGIQGL